MMAKSTMHLFWARFFVKIWQSFTQLRFLYTLFQVDGELVSPSATARNWFYVNRTTGHLFANQSFDFETGRPRSIELNATALTVQDNSWNVSVPVTITVSDANDNSPSFLRSRYSFHLAENSGSDQRLGVVRAIDRDEGQNAEVEYFLLDSGDSLVFQTDPANFSSGELFSRVSFDRETKSSYTFLAYARDNGAPPRTGSVEVVLYVDDVNDNPPTFVDPPSIVIASPTSTIGDILHQFDVSDADLQLSVTFAMEPVRLSDRITVPSHFSVDGHGRLIVSRSLSDLVLRDYPIRLVVSDSDPSTGLASSTTVSIRVAYSPLSATPVVPTAAADDNQSSSPNIVIILAAIGGAALLLFLIILIVIKLHLMKKNRRYQTEADQKSKSYLTPSKDVTAISANRPSSLNLGVGMSPSKKSGLSSANTEDYMLSLESRVPSGTPGTPRSDVLMFSNPAVVRVRSGIYSQDPTVLGTPSSGEHDSPSHGRLSKRYSVRTTASTVEGTPISEDIPPYDLPLGSLSFAGAGAEGSRSSSERASPRLNYTHMYSSGLEGPYAASTPQSASSFDPANPMSAYQVPRGIPHRAYDSPDRAPFSHSPPRQITSQRSSVQRVPSTSQRLRRLESEVL